MAIFLTSDQHWGHNNILKFCQRPFDSIAEHDAELVLAWNSVVSEEDVVYHLGDVTLGNSKKASEIFRQLNGMIHVLGYTWHHDARWIGSPQQSKHGLVEIEKPIIVLKFIRKTDERQMPLVLCHYPFEIWDRKHYGAVHFHGHTHAELAQIQNRLDVGVDMAYKLLGSYRPFRLEEALEIATSTSVEDSNVSLRTDE